MVYNGSIYISDTYGVNFTAVTDPGKNQWTSIASDSTGNLLVAASLDGLSFKSIDGGITWQPLKPKKVWVTIVSSSSGTILGGLANKWIYTSSNGGLRWTRQASPGKGTWTTMAISSGMYYYGMMAAEWWRTLYWLAVV